MATDSGYVVSMIAPLSEAEAFDAASTVAPRLGVPRDRLARLFARGSGSITKPLKYEDAERIGDILTGVGVPVRVVASAPGSRPSSPAWPEFGPDEPEDPIAGARWSRGSARSLDVAESGAATPRGVHGGDPQGRASDRHGLADDPHVRANDQKHHDQKHPAADPDDDSMVFDWNQPIGFARWRRPLMLIALLVAIGLFALLQLDASSSGDRDGADVYGRGLAAYRVGAFPAALRSWEQAAAGGDERALYMLGYMSEYGQGQEWSNRRAAEYYRQAAERGSVAAQFALASLYERGLGVPLSERTAVRWYRLAAQNGHAQAQYRLALAYVQGRGTERDWPAALAWFEAAARNGVREAEAFATLLRAVPQSTASVDGGSP